MFSILLAALVQVSPVVPTKTIIVDNSGPCIGGRINSMRAHAAKMDARRIKRQWEKEGYKVNVITLSPGVQVLTDLRRPEYFISTC